MACNFVDSYGQINYDICRTMHFSALVYTRVITNIMLFVPLQFNGVSCFLTVGTWHIQYGNCISNILCNVHNSYNTCQCHNVQGKFSFALALYIYFLTHSSIYPSCIFWTLSDIFILLDLFLMHASALALWQNSEMMSCCLIIYTGLVWSKPWKHHFWNLWFGCGVVRYHFVACDKGLWKDPTIKKCVTFTPP